jgi:hypothetical protein
VTGKIYIHAHELLLSKLKCKVLNELKHYVLRDEVELWLRHS